jgi:hypothetical protein
MPVGEKHKSKGGRMRSEKPLLAVIWKPCTSSQNDESLDFPFLLPTRCELAPILLLSVSFPPLTALHVWAKVHASFSGELTK